MRIPVVLILIITLFSSCKKDREPGTLVLDIKATYQGAPFELGQVYEDHLGHRIRADIFKTYLSDIQINDENGVSELIQDIALIDFGNPDSFSIELDAGTYSGFRFGTGVPADRNKDSDPNQYPNDHPLSVNGSQGMFWFWNTGYIFTKYEGKVDLEGVDGNELLDPFAFHCGEDFLFDTHEYGGNIEIESDQETRVIIEFRVDEFLVGEDDSIDLELDYLTHTSGNIELAERFMELFNESIRVTIE